MIPRQARQPVYANPQVRKHRPDYGLLIIACVLLGVGMIVMYAISPALAAQGGGVSDSYFVIRQFIAIILGIVAFFIASRIFVRDLGQVAKTFSCNGLNFMFTDRIHWWHRQPMASF